MRKIIENIKFYGKNRIMAKAIAKALAYTYSKKYKELVDEKSNFEVIEF